MPDPRFFTRTGPHSLAKVCQVSGVDLPASAHPYADELLEDVAGLKDATQNDYSLLHNLKYKEDARQTKARAVFCRPQEQDILPAGTIALVHNDPYKAYALAALLFYPLPTDKRGTYCPGSSIARSAIIDPSALIHPTAVVEAKAEIGANAVIEAHAYIGPGVKIGRQTRIGTNSSVSHSIIGDRVFIYPGARVGQPGFGFAMSQDGFVTVPQLGRVLIEDEAEVGANTCIDRGSLYDTVIGRGTRIDNLVQIAHNVTFGNHCVVVSQVGISGSTKIGSFASFGGQAGITGHLQIGDRAQIAAQSGVMRDVASGEIVGGSPSMPIRQWHRQTAALKKLTKNCKERHDVKAG